MVSLCDGVGGIFLALQIADRRFRGLSVEKDRDLGEFVHQRWKHLELLSDVAKLSAEQILKKFRASGCTGLLLVGGPPCQPFSSSGKRWGFRGL